MKTATLVVLGGGLLAAGAASATAEEPPSAPSLLKNGYVDVGSTRLYYEEMGEGPPLVMLHGGLLDRRMWDPQFEVFAERHRVIRYDARNHGKSSAAPGLFTHYEDLLKLLDQLEIEKATLMGLSLGGRTIIDFCIAHPERVITAVLVSPGAGGYEFKSDALKANGEQMSQAFRDGDLARGVEYFQRSWTDGPARSPSDVPPEVREKVRSMAMSTVEAWNSECRAKDLDPPAIGRLDEIRAPTLVVLADLDMPGILEIGEAVKEKVSGAEVVVMRGAAHMVNMEKPEEFNRVVLEYLDRTILK